MKKDKYYKASKYDNFYEMLYGINKKYSKRIAIKFKKSKEIVEITYRALIQEISNLKNYYDRNKIKNQNIGIISENRYEYITIYLSSVFNNVIAPIDKEVTSDILEKMLVKFDIKVLFYTNKTKEKVLEAVKNLNVKLLNIDEEYSKLIEEDYLIDNFFEDVKNVNKDKFSVLVFTSGTTGEMKGVMLSQYNITSNLCAARKNLVLKSPNLLVLPMNHTYGFNPGVLTSLYIGSTLCINMDLKNFAKDLKYYNPDYICVVPMMAEGIYNNIIREVKRQNKEKLFENLIKISNFLLKFKIDVRQLFFSNFINKRLRLMVCGGAFLDSFYVERYNEIGIKLVNGYGITECSPLVSVNMDKNIVLGSVGKIIAGDDIKIAKDGEILVKGPNVMLGYYKDKKATRESIKNGYYKTGDFGYKENDILYITGRKKNLIILENGKNVSPEAIESKLLKISYIKECVVTSKKNKNASKIIAKLYMEGDFSNIDNDLKLINDSLPSYMKIEEYEIMENEFEKTSTKKIKRSKYV